MYNDCDHNAEEVTAMRTRDETGVAVIGKMAEILDAISEGIPLNASEISRSLGIPRTTVNRLLQTMVSEHMLTPTHQLGPRLVRWASKALRGSDIRQSCGPVLEKMVARFGETASVFVRSGATRVCLDRREGTESVRHNIDVGAAMPIHVGSAGRILLAWLTPEERQTVIAESSSWSGVPILQPEPDWDLIRETGWLTTVGERDPILASVSVPLFGADGVVLAALSLSGPKMRFARPRVEEMASALREEAARVGQQLQHVGQSQQRQLGVTEGG